MGACKELKMDTDDPSLQNYLKEKGCTWLFNPLHSSHMGGSWERLIGLSRRILDAMLLKTRPSRLTHEVLSTLMAEVMAIMNARPLLPVSTDPENPTVLTPAMILTQKMSALAAPCGHFDTSHLHDNGNNGSKYNVWQIPFGSDGGESFCPPYKAAENGQKTGLTLKLEM